MCPWVGYVVWFGWGRGWAGGGDQNVWIWYNRSSRSLAVKGIIPYPNTLRLQTDNEQLQAAKVR